MSSPRQHGAFCGVFCGTRRVARLDARIISRKDNQTQELRRRLIAVAWLNTLCCASSVDVAVCGVAINNNGGTITVTRCLPSSPTRRPFAVSFGRVASRKNVSSSCVAAQACSSPSPRPCWLTRRLLAGQRRGRRAGGRWRVAAGRCCIVARQPRATMRTCRRWTI